MSEILNLLYYSLKAVGAIFLVASAGAFLVRFKYLEKSSLRILSQIVFVLMLPCLLFVKMVESVEFSLLKEWFFLPLSCVIYAFIGMGIGRIAMKFIKPRPEFANCAVATCGFANSGFIPIPLVMAVCSIFPFFENRPESGTLGVAMVSIYLLGFSPLYWTLGYSLIAGRKMSDIRFSHLITPPIMGMLLGVLIGLAPPLKRLLCAPDALLRPLYQAIEIISNGAVPCALIVLGGMLAFGPKPGKVNRGTIFGVAVVKLILIPLFAIFYIKFLRFSQLIPSDPLFALVLLIEAAVPPGANLVVMCSLLKNGQEDGMASLLFWTYLLSVPVLTIIIMLGMWLFT